MWDCTTFAETCRLLLLCLAAALSLVVLSVASAILLARQLKRSLLRICSRGVAGVLLMGSMFGIGVWRGYAKFTNDPPNMARPPPAPLMGGLQPPIMAVTAEDISNGWRVAATREGHAPSRPQDGACTIHEPWLVRGGFEDVMHIPAADDWSFPWRGGFLDGLTVFSDGKIRPALRTPCFPRPFDAPLAVVPAFNWHLLPGGVSNVFWHAATPSNSLIVAWENAPVGNDVSCLTNFQAEFFADGRFDYRYQDRTVEYVPVFPFDWDGDGLENSVDPEPLAAGPDAHGTNTEWYNVACSNVFVAAEGGVPASGDMRPPGLILSPRTADVNTNAYYFVEVVAERGPVPIYFTADRESRLGSPVVVARGGVTNYVPLLMGIEYAVTSTVPITVSVPSNAVASLERESGARAFVVRWPLEFVFSESLDEAARTYTLSVAPFDPEGELTWNGGGGEVLPMGTLQGCSCGCMNCIGRSVRFVCSSSCPCDADCRAVGDYGLEGATFAVTGGMCRCGFDDPPLDDPAEHGDGPSLAVTFSRQAVMFEDAYIDKPGVQMPKRSSRVRITVDAYGGTRGGTLSLSSGNVSRLAAVGGGLALPDDLSLVAGSSFHTTCVYEGASESAAEGDVYVSGTFTEFATSQRISASNSLTVVRILLKPIIDAPRNNAQGRHTYGVCELAEHVQFPSVPAVTWNPVGGGANIVGADGKPCYRFPLRGCENPLRVELGNAIYLPRLSCIEPEEIVAREVELCTYGLPPGKAGGIGILQAFFVAPFTVSFTGIAVEEVPCDRGSIEGYFQYALETNLWTHTSSAGAGVWHDIAPDNRIGGLHFLDEAAISEEMFPITASGTLTNDYSFGWTHGTLTWEIPFGWNVSGTSQGTGPAGVLGATTQAFHIDPWGTTHVRKFNNQVTRTADDKRYLNGVRVFDNTIRSPCQ